MIEKELDLLHVWGDYIGFTPVIGSFYGGIQSGEPSLIHGNDVAKRLPGLGFVWIRINAVDALLAQSETACDPFCININFTLHTRQQFRIATLVIPLENRQTLLDALAQASTIIRNMGAPRPERFALLRMSKTERYIVFSYQRANETPIPVAGHPFAPTP